MTELNVTVGAYMLLFAFATTNGVNGPTHKNGGIRDHMWRDGIDLQGFTDTSCQPLRPLEQRSKMRSVTKLNKGIQPSHNRLVAVGNVRIGKQVYSLFVRLIYPGPGLF